MFSITSRLKKLSLCFHRFSAASSQSISSSSPARKVTLEQKLGIRPKPKRPLTAFFRFTQEIIRPNLLKENPNLLTNVTQVTKVAAQQWKAVDDNLKKKLYNEFQREMEQYRAAMEGYKEELSKVDRETLKKYQLDPMSTKEKNALKKQRSALGCPKKPMSSFFLYLQKRKAEIPNPSSHKDLVATITEEWKNLDPNEKAKYKEMQDQNKVAYDSAMALWEREMRESGNAHLLGPQKSPKRPRSQ